VFRDMVKKSFSRPTPAAFETETSLETFETETRKNGLETSLENETRYRDSVTGKYKPFLQLKTP